MEQEEEWAANQSKEDRLGLSNWNMKEKSMAITEKVGLWGGGWVDPVEKL